MWRTPGDWPATNSMEARPHMWLTLDLAQHPRIAGARARVRLPM
jgi:hypothetical protein